MNRRQFLRGVAGAVVTASVLPGLSFVLEKTGATQWAKTTLQDVVRKTMIARGNEIEMNIRAHNALLTALNNNNKGADNGKAR